jgi:HK97 gp10 family phage protein
MPVTVSLDTRGLDRLAARLGDRVDAVVRTLAFRVEAAAKKKAPVDSGFLRSSIQVRDKRIGDGQAEVIVGAEYGLAVHEGARGRAARPFLADAVKEVESELPTVLAAFAGQIEKDAT